MTKKIALLGFGTIGSSVGKIISVDGSTRREQLKVDSNSVSSIADSLADLEIVAIVTLDKEDVEKAIKVNPDFENLRGALVTKDYQEALNLGPDIVVELIGGINPAKDFIKEALMRKIHVVTANKAVLGTYGTELRQLAESKGTKLFYEAAVGGAVPIVRVIRHSLMGDKIISIRGVLNGTTNFILDEMTSKGADYSDALKEAQNLGFAEADPSADVDGFDPAAKIAILGSLAFGRDIKQDDVDTTGITEISQGDIIKAKNDNLVYKLVATATRSGENIALKVEPELVPSESAFGQLKGSQNAVEVISEYSTTLTFFGPGAGGDPTASAVLADIIEASID